MESRAGWVPLLLLFFASKLQRQLVYNDRRSSSLPVPGEEDTYVRITSPRQQVAYLAQLDDTAIKTIAPLTPIDVQTEDGSSNLLYDVSGSSADGVGSMQPATGNIDKVVTHVAEDKDKVQHSSVIDESLTTTTQIRSTSFTSPDGRHVSGVPLVVMIASCIAAFVGFLGICLALYISTFLRPRVLTYKNSWEMLSCLEQQLKVTPGRNQNFLESKLCGSTVRRHLLLSADVAPAASPDAESNSPDNLDLITFKDEEEVSSDNEMLNIFEDTISDPPTPRLELLPEIKLSAADNDHPNSLPPLLDTEPGNSPIFRTPMRTLLEMREATSSPSARPAWSLRADEDASLFVPSPPSPPRSPLASTLSVPPPASDIPAIAISAPRRHAYRSPVPEFDIALAMQLRPGLGLGADSAWMVRFLMAMFGWFTVLLTSRKESQQRWLAS